jgi:menaquinone-dependent protoporphyrinogen oxidase
MKVLVTFGSKRGGTEGLAEMLAGALRDHGLDVDVVPAGAVRGLDGYGAVVVGGALYAMRWSSEARRFVRRNAAALRQLPVWFFSSGPLDDSAATKEIPPVSSLAPLIESVGGRGHVTFGGRLAPDAKGFVAGKMAKQHAGDWRDEAQVRSWAESIAGELGAPAAAGSDVG